MTMKPLRINNIPNALRERSQWIVWRLIDRDGKQTKVPFHPSGLAAKTDDPETWVSFEEAARVADRFSGIYSGEFEALSAPEKVGREIWVNSCASCHEGPSGIFGGTKAGRPFQVVRAYARYDRHFFEDRIVKTSRDGILHIELLLL